MNPEPITKHLTGKTAIVTGASSGIGRATAISLAQSGAHVVLHARRKQRLDEVAAEIKVFGGHVFVVAGDMSKPADLDSLLEQTLAWNDGGNKYDILVANAGRGLAGGLLNSDEAQWQDVYQTNTLGTAHLLRKAGLYMKERKGGDIVVISSTVGRNISPFSAFYGSSKFAIASITEALRQELAAFNVRVSLVMPGIVISGFQEVAGYDKDNFFKAIEHYGKPLEPQAIADGIHWILQQPPHVNVSEIIIRPTGQNYP